MEVCDLGIIDYRRAFEFQTGLVNRKIADHVPDTLVIAEHYPVVTLGRLAKEAGTIERGFFDKKEVPVISTNRGGQVTYHAPGQIVMYPVIDLSVKKKDISFFIDMLEKTVSASLNRLNVPARRLKEKRGVWVEDKKIAFIGIAVKRWVTFHGVAVNINNDLTPFSHMHPCGESGIRVTSVEECTGRKADMEEVKRVFVRQFKKDLDEEYAMGRQGRVSQRSDIRGF